MFRDHHGSFLHHFEKHVNTESTIHAEVLAIREGLLIATTFRWFGSMTFEIESGSVNVIS